MNKTVGYIVMLVTAAFCVWLLWLFIVNIRKAESSVIVGLIGFLGMISAALVTHYQTKKREISSRHFADRRDGYMKMIDLIFDIMQATKKDEKLSQEEMIEKIIPFKKTILIWGGTKIIEAWNQFELTDLNSEDSTARLLKMDHVLKAIRKDLGHDDSTMSPGSLIALFIVAKDKNMVLEG